MVIVGLVLWPATATVMATTPATSAAGVGSATTTATAPSASPRRGAGVTAWRRPGGRYVERRLIAGGWRRGTRGCRGLEAVFHFFAVQIVTQLTYGLEAARGELCRNLRHAFAV